MTSAAALRYARALAESVLSPGSVVTADETLAQVKAFAALLRGSQELHTALLSPSVQASRKRDVIAKLGEPLGISRPVRNFLFILADRRRMPILPQIAEALESIFDERLGIARADISTAREIGPEQAAAIEAQLGRLSGKRIRPRYRTDPELLGGALARIGSVVYDGSLRGQIAHLRGALEADSAAEGRQRS